MLAIYKEPTELFSSTNPFTVTFDGRIGGSQDRRLYIRNDSDSVYYTNITVSVVDVGSEGNILWKLKQKDIPPTNDEWMEVATGNTLSISSDIGSSSQADTATYLSFWIKAITTRGQDVRTLTNYIIRLSATEYYIG